METLLHIVDTLALVAMVWLLASGRLIGPPGLPGRDGKDGKDGQPGHDGQDGAPGRDGVDAPSAGAVRMVQILRDGVPYHMVPFGHPYHHEALTGKHGLSVKEL
jgi:hypothetical protein